MDGNCYSVNEPSVISEVIDGETIVLNFETGHYYSFNPSASEIWRHVSAGQPLEGTAEGVARRFAVDPPSIRPAIAAFVDRLVDEHLLRPVPAAMDTSPAMPLEPPGPATVAFAPPTFEKFTDMEEMLLRDPIHEVSDAGWPSKSA